MSDPQIPYAQLATRLEIRKGEILLVSSSLSRLILRSKKMEGGFDVNLFIDSFKSRLTEEGTLLFPTYHFGFCRGIMFDYKHTPSEMGVLSNAALARRDFVRTRHPVYSFAVTGKYSRELLEMENRSAFGIDSPFHFLYEKKARMLIIGLDYQHSFTFVHYVEEKNKVPYRYLKDFEGLYVDETGRSNTRTYSLYVRDLERKVETCVNPMGEIFEKRGAATAHVLNGVVFRLVDLHAANALIEEDIRINAAKNLYRIAR